MPSTFTDHRAPALIHHPVVELVRQRVFGIACGYEDLSDHSALRVDPLLAAVVGKADPTEPLASSSTLNQLELTPADATGKSRYRKVVYEAGAIENFFVDAYLDAYPKAPPEVILDLDATDDPIHGTQEGRFFHGYYGNWKRALQAAEAPGPSNLERILPTAVICWRRGARGPPSMWRSAGAGCSTCGGWSRR